MPSKKTAESRSSREKMTKRLMLLNSCLKLVKLATLIFAALTKLVDAVSKFWDNF